MALSAPFSAPQRDWETNDSILAFGKFKQKCELIFKSILNDAEGEEQVSYILLWVGDPAKILDRFMEHLEPRKSSNSQVYFTRYATRPR